MSLHRFNPRAREGRDLSDLQGLFDYIMVSIHAPARGATCFVSLLKTLIESCFNPRAREGRDLQDKTLAGMLDACFNPRAREGRDIKICKTLQRDFWFQSTRPRGARPTSKTNDHANAQFQSTRPRGARRHPSGLFPNQSRCFNPRAREGRDDVVSGFADLGSAFQSTRPRGARPAGVTLYSGKCHCFNPRAREGRDSSYK